MEIFKNLKFSNTLFKLLRPHNVWNQTRNDQLSALNVLSSLFLKYFPQKVIYSTLGNHEGKL